MVDNKEFIAAKDLPATEAKEVDVLCVEPKTGELVRKPGASLGGGAEEYDAVVHMAYMNDEYAILESGSRQAVINKLAENKIPKVLVYGAIDMTNFVGVPSTFTLDGGVSDSTSLTIPNMNYKITISFSEGTVNIWDDTSFLVSITMTDA